MQFLWDWSKGRVPYKSMEIPQIWLHWNIFHLERQNKVVHTVEFKYHVGF